jgi:hypothetical protein
VVTMDAIVDEAFARFRLVGLAAPAARYPRRDRETRGTSPLTFSSAISSKHSVWCMRASGRLAFA